jgi:hypothetical protein
LFVTEPDASPIRSRVDRDWLFPCAASFYKDPKLRPHPALPFCAAKKPNPSCLG